MKNEYQISIVWKDDVEQTYILCPYDMVLDIVKNLPIKAIEIITITECKEAL